MVTLSYTIIGSMAGLHLGAGVLARCMLVDPGRTLMPDPCPLVGRISNFFAPAKSSTICIDRIAILYRQHNGRSLKKEGYARLQLIETLFSLTNS